MQAPLVSQATSAAHLAEGHTDVSAVQGWHQVLQHEVRDRVGPSHQLSDHQIPLCVVVRHRPVVRQPPVILINHSEVQGNNLKGETSTIVIDEADHEGVTFWYTKLRAPAA